MISNRAFSLILLLAFGSLSWGAPQNPSKPLNETLASQVVIEYAGFVHRSYAEAVQKARQLLEVLRSFVKQPTSAGLEQAKTAWKQARDSYSITETFRFYGGPIDGADKGLETFINSWPVDEVYIDYVKGKPEAGLVQNPKEYKEITKNLLMSLNQKNGERNVSTGYHAIEFLLWGQDEVGHLGGQRPLTDYTTHAFAERRKQMLVALGELLVEHLEKVSKEWEPGSGTYLKNFLNLPKIESLKKIMLGMTTLSADEMSGERLTVALELKDPENEQDCFSDYTLSDLASNQQGILQVYTQKAASLESWIAEKDKKLAKDIRLQLQTTLSLINQIPVPFDEVITEKKNAAAIKKVRDTIDSLRKQASLLAKGGHLYGIELNVQEESKH